MIQLPSKIRTTLFTASIELEPYQLFSHEDDRILVIFYQAFGYGTAWLVGRSLRDAINGDTPVCAQYSPIYIYGPEPLFIGIPSQYSGQIVAPILVHAIYRA